MKQKEATLERIKDETSTRLMVIRVQGIIALMFQRRGIEPSAEEFENMTGDDLTIQELAAIAHKLGFHIDFASTPLVIQDEE